MSVERSVIALPVAIVSGATIDGDNPPPMPVVMPMVVISVVVASVGIPVVVSTVIIGRSLRRRETRTTEHHYKHR